jgi:hypothetical protein
MTCLESLFGIFMVGVAAAFFFGIIYLVWSDFHDRH